MTDPVDNSVVWWLDPANSAAADPHTAEKIGIRPVVEKPSSGFYLARDSRGLALHSGTTPASTPIRCDLTAEATRRGGDRVRQMPLTRACGLHRTHNLRIVDATAGLARDAVTLACAGASVQPVERHPALFALLEEAHVRLGALSVEHAPSWFARLLPPIHANAIDWLASEAYSEADLIYMDPMFDSPRRKAKPQKALAWLAAVAGPDVDAAELLAVARRTATRRVVVKRHARATPIAPADHQVAAKAVRFDVYLAPH